MAGTLRLLRRLFNPVALALAGAACCAQAMEFRVAGNELHLSGAVRGDEPGMLRDAAAAHPAIDTVVFRGSPGGSAWAAYRIGEAIRDAGWRTVVAGACHSACAIMFLGGRSRHFIDAARPGAYLAFHGTWNSSFMDSHAPGMRGRPELRAWVLARTAGKADAALVERFVSNERRATFLYVYDPALAKDVSMYFCEGNEPKGARPAEACEKIAGRDALSMGFVTSTERVRVTPPSKLPRPFQPPLGEFPRQ